MEYDDTNKGAIWKNDRKEAETHPDYTGSINVDGVEYWLNAWRKSEDASERAPVLKFSVKRKDAPRIADENNDLANSGREFNDDIPF